MTPKEYEAIMLKRLADINEANLIYSVATKIHDDMTRRIFDNGVMGDGNKIGTYSTAPMYVTKKQFKNKSAFKAQGKNTQRTTAKNGKQRRAPGAGKFNNGNNRKSMYLPDGYKQLKQIQGYESDFVNLVYSSDLRNDFASKLAIDGNSVVLRLSRKINRDKTGWLTEKYGEKLFKHNKEERDFFIKEVTKKLIKAIS